MFSEAPPSFEAVTTSFTGREWVLVKAWPSAGMSAPAAVLSQLDAVEAQGIVATDVSPAYWRMLGNRLASRLPLPAYTTERHAAWLAGRALS